MKTITQIIDTKDKESWGQFLEDKKNANLKRPLMAKGFRITFNEKHPTHDFHTL